MQPNDLQIHKHPATLRLLVEDKLRMAIAMGHFRPGQRLIERELCEMLGVGRTSVREAIRQLEAEGIVTTIPHRGPEVSSITYEEARQLYAFRALLESYAGEQFALLGGEAEFERLSIAITQFDRAAKAGSQREMIAAKAGFYDVMMEGARNSFVAQALRNLHNRITLLRVTSMTQPGRLKNSVRELRQIHAAIAKRDGAAAAILCRGHVENASAIALEVLRKQQTS